MTDFTNRASFIKICGVTSEEDARMVVESGADALGMIFAPSPRRVSVERAAALATYTEGRILRVGVFGDTVADGLARALATIDLDAVQIHGPLGDEAVAELRAAGVAIVKALAVDSSDFWAFDETRVDAILIDGPRPGSGQTHSWDVLADRHFERPVIAAGGLAPENVAEVLRTTRAWGVDVATGVEEALGVKSRERLRAFVGAAGAEFNRRREQRA